MNHQVWNDIINNEQYIINSKKIRVFPYLKDNKDYNKLQIDDESFNFITIREISVLITKIICKYLIQNKINPLKAHILDSTAGVGGNTLSFLNNFKRVTAIEICNTRYSYLVNNINIYKYKNAICHNIDFCEYYKNNNLMEDFDVMFMDPPWGGIGYKNLNNLQLKLGNTNIETIIIDVFKIYNNYFQNKKTKLFVLKLPKNYDIEYFYEQIMNNKIDNVNIKIYLYILSKMLLVICEFTHV